MFKFFRRKKNDGATPEAPNVELKAPDPTLAPEETLPVSEPVEIEESAPTKTSWFARLKGGLQRTRAGFTEGIASLFLGKKEIDEKLLEHLESHLLKADVGVEATKLIIQTLTQGISRKELKDPQAVYAALQKSMIQMLVPCEQTLEISNQRPFVLLMIGVNGAGKTTTIGKLSQRFQESGLSVMLAAGDTFRAAAIEQLKVWGERNQVPVVAQHTGADSASVIFDAIQSAKARDINVLIADTAGRLHTRDNLMEELKKVKKVIQKIDPSAPHEVMLVLDAGMGQNALQQALKFHEALGVTGITLTKLDGTAKGGIIFAIANKLKLPIRFIGVGEKLEDLRPFQAEDFVKALFEQKSDQEN
ncbi:MAG: signal recognition particle-docking protein FtsY [Gammaproteobacteria bacterium]|jgi:fused signal recognition particle receptor|nr:signal recognition particle-docking protein FtsY [Gammaproteobacteria bacterium]